MNATKNLLDGELTRRPRVFSDLTGQETDLPRMDLAETLLFVQEVNQAIAKADRPKVDPFVTQFALRAACQHMGWLPAEVSAAEQYLAVMGAAGAGVAASSR